MAALIWVLPIILSMLLGISLVSYLTVSPLQMSFYLFITTVVMSALVWVLASLFLGKKLLLTISLSLLFFSAGYALRTHQVLSREDVRSAPKLTRLKGDPGDGHTAVIYITHGEPETFNPIGWLNQFREFDQQDIPFVPWAVRPLFIFQLRQAYLEVGQSHHRQMHIQMLKQLEGAFRAEGDTSTKFYLSFLDDEPRPDAALIQALNEEASQIVVAEVFVSISNHTVEGEKLIKEVHAEELGVPVVFTNPLWDSAPLQQSFVAKANAALDGTDRAKVGVILVGHSQPAEWDREFPIETEHELLFREQILNRFEADGNRMENMELAWMEFREPQPAEKVEALIMNRVEKIFYFPDAISADSIHSQYDIPELMGEAKVPAGFTLVNLEAWNDHPQVIQAIKDKIQSAQNMGS